MPKKFSKKDKENLIKILKESDSYFCSIRDCCKKAGIGKSTFYRWLKEDTKFKERVSILLVERNSSGFKLLRKVSKGDVGAMIKLLTTYGKDRGW